MPTLPQMFAWEALSRLGIPIALRSLFLRQNVILVFAPILNMLHFG